MATTLEATESSETIMLHISTSDDRVIHQQIATFDMTSDQEHRFDRVILQQFNASSESKLITLNASAMDALCDAWLAKQGKMEVKCNTDKPAAIANYTCEKCDAGLSWAGNAPPSAVQRYADYHASHTVTRDPAVHSTDDLPF